MAARTRSILAAFLFEAVLLAVVGGALRSAASLAMTRFSTVNFSALPPRRSRPTKI
jgi:uncharacterized membrane protein